MDRRAKCTQQNLQRTFHRRIWILYESNNRWWQDASV